MALTFNMLLESEGIDPADVRLLRHQARGSGDHTAYGLWRDHRPLFEAYQATQQVRNRVRLAGTIWASFIVAPDGRTLFAGLYRHGDVRVVPTDWPYPLSPRPEEGEDELHELVTLDALAAYAGCLAIDWGGATRSWVQRADQQNKAIVELSRTFEEPPFPGFSSLLLKLSSIDTLPAAWASALAAARGVYLLTCPRTKELYTGSAVGGEGFLARWRNYAANGHGGNVMLRSREPSDYQISILEVAGSLASEVDILALESRWKAKLQSREMGLNAN